MLAMEVVWGGKPGEATKPENIYTAGIGGIQQAFDQLRAERVQLINEVERLKAELSEEQSMNRAAGDLLKKEIILSGDRQRKLTATRRGRLEQLGNWRQRAMDSEAKYSQLITSLQELRKKVASGCRIEIVLSHLDKLLPVEVKS